MSIFATKITEDVYIHNPTANSDSGTPADPEIVLIFGWMGAQLTHLVKYMQSYADKYPAAKQISVRAKASSNWNPESSNMKVLDPVVLLMKDYGMLSERPPRCLVHVFSNGGGFQLVRLNKLLSSLSPPPPTLALKPTSALIFDSTPGEGGLHHILVAFTEGVPNPMMKAIAYPILTVMYIAIMTWIYLTNSPSEHPFPYLRASLHNPSLLPFLNKYTPRLYICSQGDEIVLKRDVKRHVQEAKEQHFADGVVHLEEFGKSKHVAHVREDPERYWRIVTECWGRAVDAT